jgi:hypothetical protein
MRTSIMLVFLFLLVTPPHVQGRNGGIVSQITIGGKGVDKVNDFIATPDGGLLLVGSTTSFETDREDVYLVKLNDQGELQWNKTWGDWESDRGYTIKRTLDKNYVISGASTVKYGVGDDVLFLKINDEGKTLYNRSYGGNAWDWGCEVFEMEDKNIIIGGVTEPFWIHTYDFYMVKTTAKGDLIWRRRVEVDGNFDMGGMLKTADGNFIVVGSASDDLGIDSNIIVIKVNPDGKKIWSRTYGGEEKEHGRDIIDTGDGYLLLCQSDTNDENEYDTSLMKIDYDGAYDWSKRIGGIKDDGCNRIINTGPDEYTLIGQTYNSDGTGADILLIIINSQGDLLIAETYGTPGWDSGKLVHKQDDMLVIMGETNTPKSDILVLTVSTTITNLNISSQYGAPIGGGDYYKGSTGEISIDKSTIYSDSTTRHVFTGWVNNETGEVLGEKPKLEFKLDTNMTLVAGWKNQYHVRVKKIEEVDVEPSSDWYDEGTELLLRAIPDDGANFTGWKGYGLGSYTGNMTETNITVQGPITQKPLTYETHYCNLTLVSDYGQVSGNGAYQFGSQASFNVEPVIVGVSPDERYKFMGWNSSSEYGYSGKSRGVSIEMGDDVTETAIWQRQFYIFSVIEGGEGSINGSGWVDENSEVSLSCILPQGTTLEKWEPDGVENYTEAKGAITFNVTGPVYVTAKVLYLRECALYVVSEYGETMGAMQGYEGDNVTFSVYPDVVELTSNTRVVFKEWVSTNEGGYNGDENTVTLTLRGDTVQEAVWNREFFIFSEENGINGWYGENVSISLDPKQEGTLVEKELQYSAEGEKLKEEVVVTGPLTINSIWSYQITNLILAAITSTSIGYTSWRSLRVVTGLNKKDDSEKDTGEGLMGKIKSLVSRNNAEEILGEEETDAVFGFRKEEDTKQPSSGNGFLNKIKTMVNRNQSEDSIKPDPTSVFGLDQGGADEESSQDGGIWNKLKDRIKKPSEGETSDTPSIMGNNIISPEKIDPKEGDLKSKLASFAKKFKRPEKDSKPKEALSLFGKQTGNDNEQDAPQSGSLLGMLKPKGNENEDSESVLSKPKEVAKGFVSKLKGIQGKISSRLNREKDEEEDDLDF